MNNINIIKIDEYYCKICNKKYKTYKTLWNHNKKFHNVIIIKKQSKNNQKNNHKTIIKNNQKCIYCNKLFSHYNNKWRHEKTCKYNNTEITKINEETKKIEAENKQKELELLIKKEESKILKLKLKLEKSNKVDNITLKQLNKKLVERNNLIKNSNIIINSNNNNTINNFQLVGFGKEDVVELLTMQEKKQIMNAKMCCLEKLINIIHCGKYNQFKNIIITNMKDNYIYKYDDIKGHFVLSMKSNVLNSLIDYRVSDIEIIYNELIDNNKLDKQTKDMVERFINKINSDNNRYSDIDGKEYESYKHHKINEVKVLLYNNQDKITNDISLLLTTTN